MKPCGCSESRAGNIAECRRAIRRIPWIGRNKVFIPKEPVAGQIVCLSDEV